jgi:hypothetical protein
MSVSAWSSRALGVGVAAVLLSVALLMPVSALAAPGDSPSNAVTLTIGASVPGTLTPSAQYIGLPYIFMYHFDLTAGQTIVATCTWSPAITRPLFTIMDGPQGSGGQPNYRFVAPNSAVMYVLAPRTGTYYLLTASRSAPGTFSVDTALAPTFHYSLSKLSAPKMAKRRKSFTISTTLTGKYVQLTPPLWFIVERRSGAKWRSYGAATPTWGAGSGDSATLFTRLKLPKGVFRIRARFRDAAHLQPIYNGWKTVTIR